MSAEMINRAIVLIVRFFGCILMVMGWLSTSALQAQVTRETYKKAEYFLSGNLQKEIFHLEVIPNWLEDTDAFWHVTNTRNGKRFFITEVASKTTLEAFDHEVLADLLKEKTGEQIDSRNLPFERIEIRKDSVVAFEWKNRNWTFDSKNGELTSSAKERQADRTGISPDKKWRAFTRDYNLFVENLETGSWRNR
jgi:dipeptidyl-peptidase 4